MPGLLQETTGQATTASYVTLLKVKIGKHLNKVHLIVTNSNATYTIHYKIYESNDPEGAAGSWHVSTAETTINNDTGVEDNTKQHTYDPAPLWIDVQVQNESGVGTANAWLKGVGL